MGQFLPLHSLLSITYIFIEMQSRQMDTVDHDDIQARLIASELAV
jgi:hypothetical protein